MKKILVIEDDLTILNLVKEFLETEGFVTYSATCGEDGIDIAKSVIPELIICDIMMPPGINGYEVLSALQHDSKTAVIPFIFLSAKVERNDVRHGMDLGADDYLTKPFKLGELLQAIETRLKKSQLLAGNRTSHEVPQQSDISVVKLPEDGHVFILVKNQPVFLKINTIECITSEAEYSNVYTSEGEKYLVRKLLKQWEEILPEKTFLRIHRSTIINLNYVQKVEKWFNNTFKVKLKELNEEFIISRRFAVSLKSKLHY